MNPKRTTGTQCNLFLLDSTTPKDENKKPIERNLNLMQKLKEKIANKGKENVVTANTSKNEKVNVKSRGTQAKLQHFETRAAQCEGTLSEIFAGTCVESAVQIIQSTEEFRNLSIQVRYFRHVFLP